MSTVNVVLVGFGMAGAVFHAPLIAAEPGLRLAQVATSRDLPPEWSTVRRISEPLELNRSHGPSGSLYQYGMDAQEAQLTAGIRPGDRDWGIAPEASVSLWRGDREQAIPVLPGAYECFYRAVAASILEGTPPPVTVDEARSSMRVLEAACLSAAEGRRIALL